MLAWRVVTITICTTKNPNIAALTGFRLLGIFVGICLGILQSWLIFLEISKELEGAKFSVPVGEVGVLIVITIIASILASVIPANEASKTYPAEALRYE